MQKRNQKTKQKTQHFPLKPNTLIHYSFPIKMEENALTFLCFVSTFSSFFKCANKFQNKEQLKIVCLTGRF